LDYVRLINMNFALSLMILNYDVKENGKVRRK